MDWFLKSTDLGWGSKVNKILSPLIVFAILHKRFIIFWCPKWTPSNVPTVITGFLMFWLLWKLNNEKRILNLKASKQAIKPKKRASTKRTAKKAAKKTTAKKAVKKTAKKKASKKKP